MKLAEAKEIATRMNEWEPGYLKENERQALQIAIEAMEREIAHRDSPDFVKVGKLPSETWEIKRR